MVIQAAVKHNGTKKMVRCLKCNTQLTDDNWHHSHQIRNRKICKKCNAECDGKWRQSNPDKVKEYKRKYNQSHGEQIKESHAKWLAANLEQVRKRNAERGAKYSGRYCERLKKWYIANKERLNEKSTKYYETHIEHLRSKARQWAKENPEKRKIQRHTRRTKKSQAGGSFTSDDIKAMLKRQKGKCIVCKVKIVNNYQIDHIIPISKGGSSNPSNLQLLCPRCNLSKNSSDNIVFMQRNGFLL